MHRFLKRQWFVIGLAVVLLVGLAVPEPFAWLPRWGQLRNFIVASVLFVTALTLETSAIKRALRRPGSVALAVVFNLVVLPLVAWATMPFLAPELGLGLMIMAAAPCTLASAAVWTRRAGGNDATALMVTAVTNLTCFVVTPLWLFVATGNESIEIELIEMIRKLGLLVVLPMLLAQLFRRQRAVADWAGARKLGLATYAQLGILTIVFIGSVRSGEQLKKVDLSDGELSIHGFLVMIVGVVFVHTIVMVAGWFVSGLCRMDKTERIAVAFAGSQKTLMVGLHIALTYYGGLAILPMVAYHVGQLIVDTFAADYYREGKMF